MASNSSSIVDAICQNEFDYGALVDLPRILERGFWGMGGDLIVEEGTAVVLTQDGRHVRTLAPGKYPLRSFQYGSQLKAYTVHTSLNTFTFTANNHFRIYERSPQGKVDFPVNVSMAVEFRVNPEKAQVLIGNGHKPVTILCTRIIAIIGNKLSQYGFDAFHGNGFLIAEEVLEQLRRGNVEDVTGLTIENVLPIAFDGADEIAKKRRESVVQNSDILQGMGFSQREIWQIRNQSGVLMAQGAAEHEIRKLILEKLLEKGSIPSFIDQPVGSGTFNDLINFLMGGGRHTNRIPDHADTVTSTVKPQTDLAPIDPVPVAPQIIDREWDALEKLVGSANLDGRPTTSGKRNTPDGGYEFIVTLKDIQGHNVEITLHLPPGYGNGVAPIRTVKRNGGIEDYPAVDPAQWRRNPKLTSLVEEVQRTYS